MRHMTVIGIDYVPQLPDYDATLFRVRAVHSLLASRMPQQSKRSAADFP